MITKLAAAAAILEVGISYFWAIAFRRLPCKRLEYFGVLILFQNSSFSQRLEKYEKNSNFRRSRLMWNQFVEDYPEAAQDLLDRIENLAVFVQPDK